MKKALILGAGMVAKPMIDYLLEDGGIELVGSVLDAISSSVKNGQITQVLSTHKD